MNVFMSNKTKVPKQDIQIMLRSLIPDGVLIIITLLTFNNHAITLMFHVCGEDLIHKRLK
jgi:hypothetical protein